MDKKIKILIGIPTASDYFHRKFMQSLMSLIYPPNYDVDINIVSGYQLPFARNRIVQHALETNSDYVYFVDADMIFPPDSLIRLLNRKVDICHALSFRRTKPYYPCAFEWCEDDKCYTTIDYSESTDDLIKVDAAGSACTLINIDVFKKMSAPYYYYRDNLFSSDLTFSEVARKLGYTIWVDRTLKIGHIGGEVVVTEELYLASLTPEAKKEWNTNMKRYLKEKELYKRK